MRISDWSSDVCSSDRAASERPPGDIAGRRARGDRDHTRFVLHRTAMGTGSDGITMTAAVDNQSATPSLRQRIGRAGGRLRPGIGGFLTWWMRSEEHTSELQSLMRISYAVFCLKQKNILLTN